MRLALSSPVYIAAGLAAAAALATVLTYRSAPGDASWLELAPCSSRCGMSSSASSLLFVQAGPHPARRQCRSSFLGICWTTPEACAWPTTTANRGASSSTARSPPTARDEGALEPVRVRLFTFASSTDSRRRLPRPDLRRHADEACRCAAAREDEFTGLPLAGLVMVTDGADTEESSIQESLLGLRASKVPVFTVGIGRERSGATSRSAASARRVKC